MSDAATQTWMSHAEYEELDPAEAKHQRDMDDLARRNLGDRYRVTRQFPCPGIYEGYGPPSNGARLFVCSECGHEVGVPLGQIDSKATTAWIVQRSGLPKLHVETDLIATPDNAAARAALAAWGEAHKNDQLSVPPILVGEPGTGKTQLLVTAAVALIEETRRPVRYWPLADLLLAERETFKTGDPSVIERVIKASVLILDDLGAERGTEFAIDALATIVDTRYREGLPTLAATNVRPSDWSEAFGGRTASRLMEACVPVQVTGVDRRVG